MVEGHVFIAASLDGFIARPDGAIDWLMKQPVDGEDYGYDAFMASVDGLVMGRGSYETVLSFETWPYEKPVVVLARSMTDSDVPAHLLGRVSITDASPSRVMDDLAARGWKHAYIDGGLVVQSFLREGLISDITLTHVPILLGSGRPLFGALETDIDLMHLGTTAYASGMVHSKYEVVRPAAG